MNKLGITKEQFESLYPQMMPYFSIFTHQFKTDEQFINEYLPSKLWRLNNLYTIIDKDGNKIPFVMNWAQHRVYAAWLEHPRLIILKSRQQGISTFWLIFFFDEALFTENLNIGLMAQGNEEASTLLERVKTAWDAFPLEVKHFLQVDIEKDNTKEYSFTNESTIFIRTSFRSATLQGLHISEFGKIANKYPERAKETNKGTLQAIKAGNTLAIESTAEGKNMFKFKWDNAIACKGKYAPKDLKPVFLSWLDDPDCYSLIDEEPTEKQTEYFEELEIELGRQITQQQRNFWIMQYRELGDDIYQEYPSTPDEAFLAAKDGTYYAKQMKKHIYQRSRIVKGLYDANLEVEVTTDLGRDDFFVLGFWQEWRGQQRLIHEYCNSGEGIEHYVEYMKSTGYAIKRTILPHDVKVVELGTNISRLKRFRDLGVRKTKVLPRMIGGGLQGGIEAVRKMFPDLWIDESCEYTIDCLNNYSKEWDKIHEVWKDEPKKSDYNHGADMVRYRAVSIKKYRVNEESEDSHEEKHFRKSRTSTRSSYKGGFDV